VLKKLQHLIKNRNINIVFQPVFDVQQQYIIGYESLSRGPEHTDLYSPDKLFALATEYELLSELEVLCRDKAISRFAELKLSGKLFLNISPMVLLSSEHPQGETIKYVHKNGLSCDQIVIELSEKYPYPHGNLLRNAIEKYRQFGFQVAIDDLGTGYSGLKQWSEVRPNIVKIDRYFVENCDKDIFKSTLIKTMFELGRTTNTKVIAEGIETKEEYEKLLSLGMIYAQGYYLAKPLALPTREYPHWALTPPQVLLTRVK